MASSFTIIEYARIFRHLCSVSLLSYRDALRDANLSVQKPMAVGVPDPDERQLVRRLLVDIIDTSRITDGVYMIKGTQETALDHHLAVNFILRERGFTARIDDNPELTIEMP